MARTDIHRPSSPDFDPEAYSLVGVFDTNPEFGYGHDWDRPQFHVSRLVAEGKHFGAGSIGQCGHCGARIRYAALLVREDVKQFIFVGEDCLDNRFDLTKAEFATLRANAVLNRERRSKQERLDALYAEHPVLVWATYAYNIGYVGAREVEDEYSYEGTHTDYSTSFEGRTNTGKAFSILSDINHRVQRYTEVSPAQVALVERLLVQISEAGERLAEREAAKEALLASGVQAPTGKVEVEGVVLSLKSVENTFGYTTTYTHKMLVQSAEGWKVWSTVPAAISEVEKGQTVRFTATLEASQDDALFAFAKRPSKASILG